MADNLKSIKEHVKANGSYVAALHSKTAKRTVAAVRRYGYTATLMVTDRSMDLWKIRE